MDAAAWEQAKAVITEALRRAPTERERFVREQCGDTPLALEIITMLAGYQGNDFLAPAADAGDESNDIQPGMRVGPYVIVDSIGRGGMGHVFLGSDPRLRRKVALKCVIRSMAGTGAYKRIRDEARAAARVTHANVATIHDILDHEDRTFIVMEYVPGESLASSLRRERLPLARVVAIGRQLAAALAAAHAQGVVHRDLKPANIQLTPEGVVKVLDFGIANAPRQPTTVASGTTTSGGAITQPVRLAQAGTPPYMAPEQLLGRPADYRSDLYSLGVVLFEMATGRRPFKQTDTAELIVAQTRGAPWADEIDANVPASFADVIAKALAIDPEARFQSAPEVDQALQSVEQALAKSREPILGKLTRVTVGLLMVPMVIAGVGLTTTTGFNLTFGLTGAFAASQSWTTTLQWGLKAVRPSLVFMLVAAGIVLVVKFLGGLLLLVPRVRRLADRLEPYGDRFAASVNLNDPSVLAQALVALGLVAIAAVLWFHADLIGAWANYVNTADVEKLAPLRHENITEHLRYRIELDVLVLAFGFGLVRVLQRRHQLRSAGKTATALLAGIVVLMVLMDAWPYRTLYQNEFERVDYSGARCYITGQSAQEFLLFCPDNPVPRNRTIDRADPRLRRLGVVENVFTGLK
jgi:serine/threonine protein kinase